MTQSNKVVKAGDNIQASINNGILTLTIDLNAKGKLSSSAKSVVLASTRGNIELTDGIKCGVNIYRTLTADEKKVVRDQLHKVTL